MKSASNKVAPLPPYNYDHVRLFPNEQIEWHSQSSWELTYIVAGEGKRTIGDTTEPFQAGEIVLILPEMPHRWMFNGRNTLPDGKIENITITFPTALLERLSDVMPELRQPIENLCSLPGSVIFEKETAKTLSHILKEMGQASTARRLVCLLDILIVIGETQNRHIVGQFVTTTRAEEKLKEIKIYVSCNFKKPLTLKAVSKHVGMNRSAFCSFFKKQTGQTFTQYLKAYRLQIAEYLLLRTQQTISEVCYESGFGDIPYFNRSFKQQYGLSPSRYRVKAGQKREKENF